MDLDVLKSVSCLAGLTDDELALFRELLEIRQANPQEQIVHEGDEIDRFYIVATGTVHVRRLAQEREVLLGRIATGGFFGEINLFDHGTATASIYAMDTVTLASVTYERMRSFMDSNPSAGYKIAASLVTELSKRMRQTNDRLVNTVYWTSLSSTPEQGR